MRRRLLTLLAFLLPALCEAQQIRSANFTYLYDLDATAITYCRLEGVDGNPFGAAKAGPANIKTTGSSATVAAVTAGTSPFANVAVTDVIEAVTTDGVRNLRVVIARADADSITVNSAWNLGTSVPFGYRSTVCGTAATSGMIDVSNYQNRSIVFSMPQVDATGGIDVRVECKDPGIGSNWVQVFPACTTGSCATVQNYATAGLASATKVVIPEPTAFCRVGMLIHTADDGDDLTTHTEQLTVTFAGYVR